MRVMDSDPLAPGGTRLGCTLDAFVGVFEYNTRHRGSLSSTPLGRGLRVTGSTRAKHVVEQTWLGGPTAETCTALSVLSSPGRASHCDVRGRALDPRLQ
jgi:hypothetical protein